MNKEQLAKTKTYEDYLAFEKELGTEEEHILSRFEFDLIKRSLDGSKKEQKK